MSEASNTTLPPDFQFTQSNLQDYVDCARRFQLKYLQDLEWPAVEAEPIADRERHMRQGASFHHMVYQHHAGVPEAVLTQTASDEPLAHWWANYLNHPPQGLPEQRYSEMALSAPLAGYRLLAKYDVIAIEQGNRFIIVDWKTNRRVPPKQFLAERLQTIVYTYLLVRAGAHLNNGQAIQAQQVEMIYWFAEAPTETVHFPYSEEQFHEDEAHLTELIDGIMRRRTFDLTTDTKKCLFCTYRSLCERGIGAGNINEIDAETLADVDDDLDFDFNFDQIAEVEF